MAQARQKTAEKLTVKAVKGVTFLDTVTIKENSNGTKFVSTPFGAVYSRIDEIEPGLHKVVQLSNDMLALNRPNREDIKAFIKAEMKDTGWSLQDVRDFYGI